MDSTERIIAAVSIAWAVIALLFQLVSARRIGRKDYSVRAGSPIKGVIYNFTWAMLPSHKETMRLHPYLFAVGVLMHIGVILAIVEILLLLVYPDMIFISPIVIGVTFGIPSLCALFLLLRRVFSVNLRSMSSIDDYLSVLITLDFLLAALAHGFGLTGSGVFMVHAALLFFYLPFGKLRHAAFCPVARAEFGALLGYRGTYPAKSGVKE